MTSQELIAAYRAELARLYGQDIADATVLVYEHGWFYLNLSRRCSDGSVGVWGNATPYQRKQLEAMLDTLRARQSSKIREGAGG